MGVNADGAIGENESGSCGHENGHSDEVAPDAATAALDDELAVAFTLSDHGVRRLRERLGLPKKAVEREIARALERGTPRTELSGRMRRTLDYLHRRHGFRGDYIVYRGCLFVFRGGAFVTVVHLTNGLHNTKAGGRG